MRIREIPPSDRPREKLAARGAGSLTDAELLAIFLRTGVKGKSAISKHFMEEAGRKAPGLAKGQLYLHLLLQPIITLSADGKSAKGAWHQVEARPPCSAS